MVSDNLENQSIGKDELSTSQKSEDVATSSAIAGSQAESADLKAAGEIETDTESRKGTFFAKINEYKELITIIVAAIGGTIFAISYFVSQEQFKEKIIFNQCHMIANVYIISDDVNEVSYQYNRGLLIQSMILLEKKQRELITLTSDDELALLNIKEALEALKAQKEQSRLRRDSAEDSLKSGHCEELVKQTS